MGSALDRLISGSGGQVGTPFEASLKVERRSKDLNIFASHNSNEACSSLTTTAKVIEGEISLVQAMENTIVAMRSRTDLVQAMAMSMTDNSLNAIASAYGKTHGHSIDIAGLYHTNKEFGKFMNAIASGFVVTAGIERAVHNPIKMYFKTALDSRASDINLKAGYEFKGNIPCITAFNADSINRVQAFVRTVASQVSTASKGQSLSDFVFSKGSKFLAPSVSSSESIISEKVILNGMDIKQLAEYLTSKFPNNIDLGLQFAKDNGVEENKLQRVSMLIKAVRDYIN